MHTLIFANGNPPDRSTVACWLPRADLIIAADGGSNHALALDVKPDVVIGDLDSIDAATRQRLQQVGAHFITYPTHKDFTDLELALQYAVECGASEITICGALGGRWDQSLANLMLLTLPLLDRVVARIVEGEVTICIVRDRADHPDRAEIVGRAGDTLSLIALKGDAHGVTITGGEYPLTDAVLPFGASLGISNVLTESVATVSVTDGLVLVVHTTVKDQGGIA